MIMKIPLSDESQARAQREGGDTRPVWMAFCAECLEDIREGDAVRSIDELWSSQIDLANKEALMHEECWADYVKQPFVRALSESALNGTLKLDLDNSIYRIDGKVFRSVDGERK